MGEAGEVQGATLAPPADSELDHLTLSLHTGKKTKGGGCQTTQYIVAFGIS